MAIDEQTVGFQGQSGMKPRISYKQEGDGFQCDAVCNSGYMFSFYFRHGPPPDLDNKYKHLDLSPTARVASGATAKQVDQNLYGHQFEKVVQCASHRGVAGAWCCKDEWPRFASIHYSMGGKECEDCRESEGEVIGGTASQFQGVSGFICRICLGYKAGQHTLNCC